jgi:hypothetical protein
MRRTVVGCPRGVKPSGRPEPPGPTTHGRDIRGQTVVLRWLTDTARRIEVEKQSKTKQPYEKPVLRPIELAADEVLAAGCKLGTSVHAGFGRPACVVRPCVGKGS